MAAAQVPSSALHPSLPRIQSLRGEVWAPGILLVSLLIGWELLYMFLPKQFYYHTCKLIEETMCTEVK